MKRAALALLLTCLAVLTQAPIQAAPPVIRILGTRAYAGNDMVKPIMVEVTVKNQSDRPDTDSIVSFRFKPQKPTGYVPPSDGVDSFSPYETDLEIGALDPGQTRTLTLRTPYLAGSAFVTRGNTFNCTIIPELTLSAPARVTFAVWIR